MVEAPLWGGGMVVPQNGRLQVCSEPHGEEGRGEN